MSVVSDLLGGGAASAAAGAVGAVGDVLDKLFTSDDERLSRQEAMERLRQQPYLAQIDLNKTEAQSKSVFVAGWRPAIGWVGAIALFWTFVAYDVVAWTATLKGWPAPPKLTGTENLFELVLAMLGLGGMRTFEKTKGVAR